MSLIYFELQHIIRKHFFTILNKLVWVLRQTQQHNVFSKACVYRLELVDCKDRDYFQ